MQTNYVLIDFENVQPKSLDHLAHEHFKLIVFVGASQTKFPIAMAKSLQRLPNDVEFIQISRNGPDALDFHIAYYIGRLAAGDPSAYFHIISKDAGFDALIDHLKTANVLARRVKAISEIPLVKISISKFTKALDSERAELVLAKLRQLNGAKPRTVKALSRTIGAVFRKQLSEEEVSRLVKELAKRGYLTIAGTKIKYALPGDGEARARTELIS